MNVYALCDPATWDKAEWFGMAFGYDPSGKNPPMFGPQFRNIDAGREVFRSFRNHVGVSDKAGLIRISVVEGEIEGKQSGYSIVIGLEPEKVHRLDKDSTNRFVAHMSRVHRVNPAPGKSVLPKFKEEFQKHNQFLFVPAGGSPERPEPVWDLTIEKYTVNFRRVEDLKPQDPDHCVLGKPWVSPDANL